MRKLLVFLAILALAGVAGDRVAHRLATDSAESRLASKGLTGTQVEVVGFPFLDQALGRRFDEVVRRVDQPGLTMRDAGGRDVGLRREVTVLGQTFIATAVGRVQALGRRLRVTATSIELTDGSTLDDRVAGSLDELFSFTYRLRDLPEGVVIRSIDPAADGFVVRLAGADVSVTVD